MDASAYLSRHGWHGAGLGYKQDGISRPVLASQKRGFSGVGVKSVGGKNDQWWLGAFDASLKNLSDEKSLPQDAKSEKLPTYFKSELYRKFIKGTGLNATIESPVTSTSQNVDRYAIKTTAAKKGDMRSLPNEGAIKAAVVNPKICPSIGKPDIFCTNTAQRNERRKRKRAKRTRPG